jgi:chromosome segregation ATPase
LETEPEKELISRGAARLRLEEAETRLTRLRAEQKELRQRGAPHQKDLKQVKTDIRSLKAQVKHACIQYRNDYSRPAIQGQFAQGIRE